MNKNIFTKKKFLLRSGLATLLVLSVLLFPWDSSATLTCTITSSCADTVIMNLSATDNAHGELASEANYSEYLCCSGVTGLNNSCSDPSFGVVLHLSDTTNAHAEENTGVDYANNVCLSTSESGDSINIDYTTDCTGYDTALLSMSASSNAHLGDSTAYSNKVCATVTQASLTFDISDTSVGFGTLSSVGGRWATGDTLGDDAVNGGTPTAAHTLSVATNASSGYVIYFEGTPFSDGSHTITRIPQTGGSQCSTDSDCEPGTEQFGLSLSTDGDASIDPDFQRDASADFAYEENTQTPIMQESGPTATETVSVSYIANISGTTEAGLYSATITYVVSGSF